MTNFKCTECKFANWKKTKAGRLSPTGVGCCNWEKTFRVAASLVPFSDHGSEFCGGWISRKRGGEHPTTRCDVFQPIKKG